MLDYVREVTKAKGAERGERLQSLWSGYGEIVRVQLEGAKDESVIVKHVAPPNVASHPRGWSSERGHARKLRSYEVEAAFYERYAARCPEGARVAMPLGIRSDAGEWLFVLEDLDASGYARRARDVSDDELTACLEWLASFHAAFMHESAEDLWPEGTYWHLATRPDELASMAPGPLRDAAGAIDARLTDAQHRTLLHGDAKLANFCFSADDPVRVAAVDFQYVGGGCGMKDVAYLLSCLSNTRLERHAEDYVDTYFSALRKRLGPDMGASIEIEWRALYPFAVADFERFLAGWAPSHAKRVSYAQRLTLTILQAL